MCAEIGRMQRMNANTLRAEMARTPHASATINGREIPDGWEGVVRQLVSTLRFGMVQITVHESHVVQVERTEKVRFAHPGSEKHTR
jgi:hypothetical protein